MEDAAFLSIKGLTVHFSRWGQSIVALDSLDLEVPRGQWLMLVGQNGSGKSTLLKAVSTRLASDSGTIRINGRNVSELGADELAKEIFHVHQDPLLGTAPLLTIYENLLVADWKAKESRLSRRKLTESYRSMLAPLGLKDRMKQLVRTLSGGERQLLALLIAQLRPASLIMLDEPLAALDPSKAELCLGMIEDLSKAGKTIVQVTHAPNLSIRYGHRTVVMNRGKITADVSGSDRNIELLFPGVSETASPR